MSDTSVSTASPGGTVPSTPSPPTPASEAEAATATRKRRLILAVLGTFALAGAAYFVYWLTTGRHVESTDDAYVSGNMVPITPQVAGIAVAIGADDTQSVRAGQLLVQLDQATPHATLLRDEAALGETVREVRSLFAQTAQLRASVAAREVDLSKAQADLARRERLASSGAISSEDVQHARDAVRSARAQLEGARQQLAGDQALTQGTTVGSNPRVQNAEARLRATYLDYERTVIPAPVAGLVAKRTVQLGERVSPGSVLMAVVPLDEVWVDANFKEGQLKSIRAGQPARLTADANDFEYHGRVVGFAAGTGAAFAVLPAQNATGNWIKVVQRLPVRIALDPRELAAHPLQIGLSMQVSIDVHHSQAAALSRTADSRKASAVAYRTSVFAGPERDLDALIANIVAENDVGEPSTASLSPRGVSAHVLAQQVRP
jgi:membrane fusion protein, multidrug efflux system